MWEIKQINLIYVLRQIFFRINKNKKEEHLIYITTIFQLNLLKEYDVLFLDGAYRSCPKSFYQIFYIIGHFKEKKLTLPILSVLMKTKYEIIKFIGKF